MLFRSVKSYDGRSDAEYVLTGRLEKLEEVDYGGGVRVQVAISAELANFATGTTVWSNVVTETGEVSKGGVPAVASEMSGAMERAINKLVSSVPATPTPVTRASE